MQSDPVARAFITQARTPATRTLNAAVGRSANRVRTRSGNLQNSRAAFESRVEGDYLIADYF